MTTTTTTTIIREEVCANLAPSRIDAADLDAARSIRSFCNLQSFATTIRLVSVTRKYNHFSRIRIRFEVVDLKLNVQQLLQIPNWNSQSAIGNSSSSSQLAEFTSIGAALVASSALLLLLQVTFAAPAAAAASDWKITFSCVAFVANLTSLDRRSRSLRRRRWRLEPMIGINDCVIREACLS